MADAGPENASSAAELGARLRFALELVETGVEMKRCSLRREHPEATEERIQELVNEWLLDRPEMGDAFRLRAAPPAPPP